MRGSVVRVSLAEVCSRARLPLRTREEVPRDDRNVGVLLGFDASVCPLRDEETVWQPVRQIQAGE